MEIQAKPTKYNGYEFRSRLEARWAVFFDAAGIKYHYEYQDFMLPSGRYLPDFYLPEFEGGCYAEVKHEFSPDEEKRCEELSALTGGVVILLDGVPDFKCYRFYKCVSRTRAEDWFESFQWHLMLEECNQADPDYNHEWPISLAEFMQWRKERMINVYPGIGIPRADQARDDQRLFYEPGYQNEDLSIPEYYVKFLMSDPFGRGVMAARSAKFEFLNTTS